MSITARPEIFVPGIKIDRTTERTQLLEKTTKPTIQQAAEWISQLGRFRHEIIMPFNGNQPIDAWLEGPAYTPQKEKLIVMSGGQRGESPRALDKHHSVTTNYDYKFTINLELEDVDFPRFLESGLVWLHVNNPAITAKYPYLSREIPVLSYGIMPNRLSAAELEAEMVDVYDKSWQIYQDLLDGNSRTSAWSPTTVLPIV